MINRMQQDLGREAIDALCLDEVRRRYADWRTYRKWDAAVREPVLTVAYLTELIRDQSTYGKAYLRWEISAAVANAFGRLLRAGKVIRSRAVGMRSGEAWAYEPAAEAP